MFGQVLLVGASALTVAIAVRVLAGSSRYPPPRSSSSSRPSRAEFIERLQSRSPSATSSGSQPSRSWSSSSRAARRSACGGSGRPARRSSSSASSAPSDLRARHGRVPHLLLDLSWTISALIGAALAPTDPAVTFSVLAGREVEGRSGTILEGESGFNDPVGIALMIGVIEFATTDDGSLGTIASEFVTEMAIGLGVGAVGGVALAWLLRHLRLPDRSLYPLAVLLFAGVDLRRRRHRSTAPASSRSSSPASSSATFEFPERQPRLDVPLRGRRSRRARHVHRARDHHRPCADLRRRPLVARALLAVAPGSSSAPLVVGPLLVPMELTGASADSSSGAG